VCLSNNCSASFLISVAGITVLGSTKQGVMLLICQIFSGDSFEFFTTSLHE
jgi:hypothetical protein